MNRACLIVLLMLLLAGCSSGTGEGAGAATTAGPPATGDWPQWRGPDRSGVSTETGLLDSWPEGGPPLLWKNENIGSGFSTVAVSDGRIYTMGDRDEGQFIIALNEADGTELWATRASDYYDNSKGGGPRATPTIVGDRLYTLSSNGDLFCLNTEDGSVVWQLNILERFDTENIKWGLSESPLVDGDLVIVLTGSPDGSMVAFNRHDGEIVWQSAGLTDEPGYASGVIATVGGVRQVVHFTDEAVVGVRVEDGKLLWRNESAANSTANCATPVVHDDHVFATSGYDTGSVLIKLTSSGNETSAEEVYFTRDMKNHHGGVVLVDGYIYGFDGNTLSCIDFETGELMWEDRSVGKGSLTAADGMLYLFGEKSMVGLARATPEGYQEVSRFPIERKRRKTWAYPVVAGGKLYLRNRDDLMCFDLKAQG